MSVVKGGGVVLNAIGYTQHGLTVGAVGKGLLIEFVAALLEYLIGVAVLGGTAFVKEGGIDSLLSDKADELHDIPVILLGVAVADGAVIGYRHDIEAQLIVALDHFGQGVAAVAEERVAVKVGLILMIGVEIDACVRVADGVINSAFIALCKSAGSKG